MFVLKERLTESDVYKIDKYDGTGKVFVEDKDQDNFPLDTEKKTLVIKDCEQLIYALCNNMEGYTFILDPTEGGFFFQNYDGLKEGINFSLNLSGTYGNNIFRPQNDETVIIQGLQITASSFISSDQGYGINALNNIYFKDCVHTKTNDYATLNTPKATISNCKFSMHIRVSEYSPKITAGATYTKCSGYFTFSDLIENDIPNYQVLFSATHDQCSFIVRNVALAGVENNQHMVANCTNCSLDIQAYIAKGDSTNANFLCGSISNCFISFKIDKAINNSKEIPVSTLNLWFDTNIDGVNIVNKGNTGDTNIPNIKDNNNIKTLSEDDCRNYNILNKWGFFTNLIEDDS